MSRSNNRHDIVVIGASAGGVEALMELVRELPADFGAAVFVVLHMAPHIKSTLPDILRRAGRIRVLAAADGMRIERGRVYVARPNRHMLLVGGSIRLAMGPRENHYRPAIDPLFRSAALNYGPRVVSVVLSGALDDGTSGSMVVKEKGGVVIAQDPATALYSEMPRNVVQNASPDHILSLQAIGAMLVSLAAESTPAKGEESVEDVEQKHEIAIDQMDPEALDGEFRPGSPSVFGCPGCGGVLWEVQDAEFVRFRCRVGHAYSPDSLKAEQLEGVEAALWTALRALEEHANLLRVMERRAKQQGHSALIGRFRTEVTETLDSADKVRRLLLRDASEVQVESSG